MRKGQRLNTDPNELRTCKVCNKTKITSLFVKGQITEICTLYRYTCKECENNKKRTGIPNTGRFKKGHKLGNRYKKGHTPWSKLNKGKYNLPRRSKNRGSAAYKEWVFKVKERDGNKCKKCGNTKKLAAHHIIPWKECEELRFDINNGISLCNSCHGKEEGFQKGHILIISDDIRKKMSEKAKLRKRSQEEIDRLKGLRKGKTGPNKGKKFSEEHRKKLSEAAKKRCQRQQIV